MGVPKDPAMLLSLVNMRLRDQYASLDEFCAAMNVDKRDIMKTLASVDYYYDKETNQFK